MTDEQLIRHFEAGQPPDEGFHHAEHVRVAWWYLRHLPLAHALPRFQQGLRRFAERQHQPALYHETITTAYVLLIDARLDRTVDDEWPQFAAAHPDLLAWKPSILDRYYTAETLWSERARQTYVQPDRPAPDATVLSRWTGAPR